MSYPKFPKHRFSKAKLIRCSDCGQYGHIAFHSIWDEVTLGEYLRECQIPYGWKVVWVWLKPHFICPDCQEKRRKWARQFLK